MRALSFLALTFLLVGCGSGKGSAPGETPVGGGGQGSVPLPVYDCLAKTPALRGPTFGGEAEAVEAFTRAAVTCGATLPALKARAARMQRDGVTIEGGSR